VTEVSIENFRCATTSSTVGCLEILISSTAKSFALVPVTVTVTSVSRNLRSRWISPPKYHRSPSFVVERETVVRQNLSVWIVAALVALLAAAGGVSIGSASDAARASRLPALPTKPMGAVDRVRVSAVVREFLSREQYKAEIPGLLIGMGR
jgi:hypothetical protein